MAEIFPGENQEDIWVGADIFCKYGSYVFDRFIEFCELGLDEHQAAVEIYSTDGKKPSEREQHFAHIIKDLEKSQGRI